MKLLLVEDSRRLRETVGRGLRRLGHAVEEATSFAEADGAVRHGVFDAIVLDRMLPGGDGLDLLHAWRRDGISVSVVVLTALGSVDERVRGLGRGADDYLAKPFAFDELVARLEAVVRRSTGQGSGSPIRTVGPLRIDTGSRTVTLHDERVELSARELSLLELLARRPGQVYSRSQIEDRLYELANAPASNAIDAAVYSLRRKLETPKGTLIQTRRGLGYVLEWQAASP